MKLHSRSVVELHDLYHRTEGERYIVGDPETGEFLIISAAQLRALQLFQTGLTVGHVRELVKDERDKVDVEHLLHLLAHKHLIHRVDGRTVHPRMDPSVVLPIPASLFGNVAIKFSLLLTVVGIGLIAWHGSFPGPGAFLYQESVFFAILAGIAIAYAYAFVRQLAKYGEATALGLPASFGLRQQYHLPLPVTHVPPATEPQQRRIIGTGLLTLAALVLGAGGFAALFPSGFANFVFLIGILELLAECFLFLGTDLSRYIGFHANTHNLHNQTILALREDASLLLKGKAKPSHNAVTEYSFAYLSSYLLAFIILVGFYLPIAVDVIGTSFSRITSYHSLAADGALSAILLIVILFWYGFATIRHHPLAHNTLFVNLSLLAIVGASYIVATLVAAWARASEPVIGVVVLFALGVSLAMVFRRAVVLAHPFTELHGLFESIVLPIIAACLPLSILFVLSGGAMLYVYAAMLSLGMLSALVIHDLQRTIAWQRKHSTR